MHLSLIHKLPYLFLINLDVNIVSVTLVSTNRTLNMSLSSSIFYTQCNFLSIHPEVNGRLISAATDGFQEELHRILLVL